MFFEELKRAIEILPLETNAVTSMAAHLGSLDTPAFTALLKELARDNHAFRYGAHLSTPCEGATSPSQHLL